MCVSCVFCRVCVLFGWLRSVLMRLKLALDDFCSLLAGHLGVGELVVVVVVSMVSVALPLQPLTACCTVHIFSFLVAEHSERELNWLLSECGWWAWVWCGRVEGFACLGCSGVSSGVRVCRCDLAVLSVARVSSVAFVCLLCGCVWL